MTGVRSVEEMTSVTRHDKRCPQCQRFVPDDADGYYDFDTPGADEHDGAYVAAFCNKAHADRFHHRTDEQETLGK